ncbi:uncharacterized protein LOC116662158 [Camelus ferus]|uniref:Uncharacterized protein LOC116662158 n=1 Tax=Camelus ferus TaxID=419612 RepID=A0A8B8SNY1_CAMFR|nr:uncharacterized protein LOC116662158 [Camelus ferus]
MAGRGPALSAGAAAAAEASLGTGTRFPVSVAGFYPHSAEASRAAGAARVTPRAPSPRPHFSGDVGGFEEEHVAQSRPFRRGSWKLPQAASRLHCIQQAPSICHPGCETGGGGSAYQVLDSSWWKKGTATVGKAPSRCGGISASWVHLGLNGGAVLQKAGGRVGSGGLREGGPGQRAGVAGREGTPSRAGVVAAVGNAGQGGRRASGCTRGTRFSALLDLVPRFSAGMGFVPAAPPRDTWHCLVTHCVVRIWGAGERVKDTHTHREKETEVLRVPQPSSPAA